MVTIRSANFVAMVFWVIGAQYYYYLFTQSSQSIRACFNKGCGFDIINILPIEVCSIFCNMSLLYFALLYFVAGIATGLTVALVAVYVHSKAMQVREHERGLAEMIGCMKEHSQLLQTLSACCNRSRSRYE